MAGNTHSNLATLLLMNFSASKREGKTNQESLFNALSVAGLKAVDPVYQDHVYIISSNSPTERLFVKERDNDDIARHEVEALLHLAKQRNLPLQELFPTLEFVQLDSYVLCPDVGPEMETVYHELNKRLDKMKTNTTENIAESGDLVMFRRALILSQVDALVDALTDPYIPTDGHGRPYGSSTIDVIGDYIRNLYSFFDRIRGELKASAKKEPDVLDLALRRYSSLLLADQKYQQPYLDTVLRNTGYYMPRKALDENPEKWLEQILLEREKRHEEANVNKSKIRSLKTDLKIGASNIIQFDAHRIERRQITGESAATLSHAGRLIDCDQFPFDRREQENVLVRYWLGMKYRELHDLDPIHSFDEAREILQLHQKTGIEPISFSDIKHCGFTEEETLHYHAINLYRVLRSCDYTVGTYIPRYKRAIECETDVLPKRIAKYRLPMAQRDTILHKETALYHLDILTNQLYTTLKRTNEQVIGFPAGVYSVKKDDGKIIFLSGKKPVKTIEGRGNVLNLLTRNIENLALRGEPISSGQKQYLQLFALCELKPYIEKIATS